MKAVIYSEPGGAEVLRYEEVADPQPGPGDVIVKVAACALNRLDVVQRNGWWQLPGFRYPHIAGMDIAGEIVAVGSAVANDRVSSHHVGERVVIDPCLAGVDETSTLAGRGDLFGELGVIGATEDGGYAEFVLVPASHVYAVPDHIPLEHAATFPTCFMTSAHALFAVGDLKAGETILIHAAGSGLSAAAIQLAKKAGATVLATAGTRDKCERGLEIGADHVFNNRSGDIAAWAREVTDGRGVDMVFDHVGQALFEQSIYSLAVHGRLVNCGNTSGDQATIPSLGFLFHMGITIKGADTYHPSEFGPVWHDFCSGNFDVVIDSTFPLADAAAAQEKMLSSDFFGKILLVP